MGCCNNKKPEIIIQTTPVLQIVKQDSSPQFFKNEANTLSRIQDNELNFQRKSLDQSRQYLQDFPVLDQHGRSKSVILESSPLRNKAIRSIKPKPPPNSDLFGKIAFFSKPSII